MGQYKANATNSQNFNLTTGEQKIGELIYTKWYSFAAQILMNDGSTYQLEPKGFWDSTIELKKEDRVLLEFKMGWKGIVIKTFFDNKEANFLLKLNGLLSSKFVLIDTDRRELVGAETNFKWTKLNFDYTIETSHEFDAFENKELLILTLLHCINYYMMVITAAA